MTEAVLWMLAAALVADRLVGDPEWLWRSVGHPVAWMGKIIAWFDRNLNRDTDSEATRYRNGAIAFGAFVASGLAAAWFLTIVFSWTGIIGVALEAFVVFALIAQKSLRDHVFEVRQALRSADLAPARKALGMIVGRDTASLDRPAISRAAMESLAENFSDGVVAPAFWYAVFGLPGIIVYKFINTADSMIGHRNPAYLYFGRVAAQADDIANWLPARISAALICLAAWVASGVGSARRAVSVAMQDSGLHRSPNAGWPEAAMAGAGDFALGGPRLYGGAEVRQCWLNGGGESALDGRAIDLALRFFDRACDLLLVFAVLFALIA